MEILTTIIYLFYIKTWNVLYKNARVFYSIFLSQQTSQTSLFLIAQHHQKQFSHSISRPNQLPKEKPNDNKPNNFSSIKLTRKKKEHMSHSYYLTPIEPSLQHLSIRPLEQTVEFVCSSLNVTNPKNRKAFKMKHIKKKHIKIN